MMAIRPLFIVRLPWLNALIPMCLLLGSILPTSVLAQEVTDINPTEEQTEANEAAATPPKLKPWLITPTLSADPKLGANVGGLIAYLKKLDA